MAKPKIVSFPRPELVAVMNNVAIEKNIAPEIVFDALEQAVAKAGIQKYGHDFNIVATVDREDGTIRIYKRITVVDGTPKIDEITGEEIPFDANKELLVADAKGLKVGDVIDEELLPIDFGRAAFQSVKTTVMQKIKSAEKDREFEEFDGKAGSIANGIVKRVEYGSVIVDLNGKAEAIIRRNETIPRENLHVGDRVRAVILEVKRDFSGPQVLLSRSHPLFLSALFAAEVPEVYEGTVEVKAVARDPGSRAKVAVVSHESSIDPVGAVVGTKGSRIQNIVGELSGEKIDVIEWTPNVAALAVDALSPAKVSKVIVDEESHRIDAIVETDQLSLAIGRHGQNVRLASQLLGWGIDVMSEDQSNERRSARTKEISEKFIAALDIDDIMAQLLVIEGFTSVEDIAMVELAELKTIQGFDEDLAAELQSRAKAFIEKEKGAAADKAAALGIAADLAQFDGMTAEILEALAKDGIKSLGDFAGLAADELVELVPSMSEEDAGKLIMKAREIAFA
ncbi:MAG: transcription termination factor NusA [Alphaproteobacteria bacterium]|nr:transcription termination factor NusA [Alphaproteobacteria bacterium]